MPHTALQPRRRTLASAILALALCAAHAVAQSPNPANRRALLDLDLRAQTITLLALDDERIAYLDDTGRRRSVELRSVAAMLPTQTSDRELPARSRARRPGLIELVDGRRFPGEHAVTPSDDDEVLWRHPLLGQMSFPLDDIARVVFRSNGEALFDGRLGADAHLRDALLLTNNDVLTGFILGLGAEAEIESDAGVVSVPAQRVLAASVANPPRPASGLMVWLDDGAAARLITLRAEGGEWLALGVTDSRHVRTTISTVRAVVPDAARLRPLAAITPAAQTALADRRVFDPAHTVTPADGAPPVVLGAHDIRFPGPMRVDYDLPPGATRFGAVAEMPRDAWPWGDCELIVSIDGREVLRERLHMNRPTADISVPARGRTLTITVEAGAYGPINNIVILRRPLLLVDQPES